MAREGIVSSRGGAQRTRLFTGGGRRPDNKKIKVEEGKERQEAWEKLGPKGQLAALDARLGKGVGAAKQRARLQNLIDNPPKRAAKKVEEVKAQVEAANPPSALASGERVKAKDRRAQEQNKRPGANART